MTVPAPSEVLFTQVQAGGIHSLALGTDGGAYAWGGNSEGALGNDELEFDWMHLPVPVLAPDGVSFTKLGAGLMHSLAVTADGLPFAWGENTYGQIGNGTNVNASLPVALPLPGGKPVVDIQGGEFNTVALDESGQVYAWGRNHYGQLGNGTTVDSNAPVHVDMPDGVTITALGVGAYHSLALAEDGTVYAWGRGGDGQLGNEATSNSATPVPVTMPDNVRFTTVGAGGQHSVALATDGTIYSWGDNFRGQLGHGEQGADATAPAPVEGVDGVTFTEITSGGDATLAVASDGTARGWGRNMDGQLGVGNTDLQLRPVPAFPLDNGIAQVSMNVFHTMVLADDGRAFGAGANDDGQLGLGTWQPMASPFPVRTEAKVTSLLFDGVPGTAVTQTADGWQAATPEHAAGPVDVTVVWEQLGKERTYIYEGGFTYLAPSTAPTVTDPSPVTVEDGESATFTVSVTGVPSPEVLWEESLDGGKTWQPVRESAAATIAGDTAELKLTAALGDDGVLFRAVAQNIAGSATSDHAQLTVTAAPAPITPPSTQKPVPPLADSGNAGSWHPYAALASLIAALGLSLVIAQRRSSRSH